MIRAKSCSAILLFLVMFWAACGPATLSESAFSISGSLTNSKGEIIRLEMLGIDSITPLDSVAVDEEGCFSFSGDAEAPAFYLLGTSRDNFITLLISKGEEIRIEGNAMALAQDYGISGSPGSELLMQLNHHTRMNYRKSDSLMNALKAGQIHERYDSIKHHIDSSFRLLFENQRSFVRNFIISHDTSLASLMALYQVFGRVRVVNEKDDQDLYLRLSQTLGKRYPQNPYVAELNQRVIRLQEENAARQLREAALDSGNVAPDIVLKTMAGYPQTLSSLRGHVVLVYFWAGWSQASQEPIPFYKFLYKKYGPKGFSIYGVSLDKDRQTWEDAVRENKMQWIQVSDLMEWNSPLVKEYNISSIPVAFLIDREGRVILKRPDNNTLASALYKIYKF